MQSRNDAVLNTGMSSALDRRRKLAEERKKQERQDKKAALAPQVDIILDWIKEEENQVADLRHIILNVSDEALLRDQLLARQLHLDFLKKLKGRARNVLRGLPKPQAVKEGESFDER